MPNAFEELDRVEPPRHKKPEAQNADFRRGGEDVGNNGSDPNALWSVPKDIETSLLPVPQMREEMLPELLSRWLLDVAKRMQCPIDLLASAAVVMFGSLVGTACRIRPKANDSWAEPPNFYGGVVSPPGTMKSPALAEIFRIIERLEVQAGDAFKEAMRDYEIALAEYEASRKKLLGTLANPPAPEGRNPKRGHPINQPKRAANRRNQSNPSGRNCAPLPNRRNPSGSASRSPMPLRKNFTR